MIADTVVSNCWMTRTAWPRSASPSRGWKASTDPQHTFTTQETTAGE